MYTCTQQISRLMYQLTILTSNCCTRCLSIPLLVSTTPVLATIFLGSALLDRLCSALETFKLFLLVHVLLPALTLLVLPLHGAGDGGASDGGGASSIASCWYYQTGCCYQIVDNSHYKARIGTISYIRLEDKANTQYRKQLIYSTNNI